MFRKVRRILLKSTGILLLILVLLGVGLYFAIQSYSFQTWLGHKTGNYLSEELGATVAIEKIKLDLFTRAELEGVFVTDKHKDTLLKGTVLVDIRDFDYKKQSLRLQKITLQNTDARLIKYKGDSTLNFQFLADYFGSNEKADTITTKNGWDIKFGDIILDNVTFTYRDENGDTKVSENMNFSNLCFKKTSGKISGLSFRGDTIHADLFGLTTSEQCGFNLSNLTTRASVSSKQLALNKLYIKTSQTIVKGNINLTYNDWGDYSDFLNKVKIDAFLDRNTHVCFKDIAVFADALNGFNETFYLDGTIKGYVSDLNLEKFKLKYGKYTKFDGNLTISGLPDINNSFLHFDVNELSTNYYDLIRIPQYPFTEGKKMTMPAQVKLLGTVSYTGKFDGFINDFTTYGSFKTGLGSASTNLSIKLGKKLDDITYHGKLKTQNFNIGALAGVKGLGSLTSNTEVKGRGLSIKAIDTDIEGKILNLTYNGYNYQNIVLNGNIKEKVFNGMLTSNDPNANFDFNGNINFKNKVPEIDFISTVNKIDLQKLNFTKEEASLSTQILITLKGDDINNMSGVVNFDNTIYKNKEKEFKFSTFDLKLDQETELKNIVLNSSYFNFSVEGKYLMTNLAPASNQLLYTFYPAFFDKQKTKTVYTDQLKYKLTIKKFNVIRDLFVKDLNVSPNTLITGDIDVSKNIININLKSDSIRFSSVKFNNCSIESYPKNNKINLVFKSSDIQLADSIKIYNYFMYFVSQNRDTKFNLEWDDKLTPHNAGKISGKVTFNNTFGVLNYDKFFITAKDSTWNLTQASPTIIDSSGAIAFTPLMFSCNNQNITINGTLADAEGNCLNVGTENLKLEQFNPLLRNIGLKLEGSLSSRVTIFNKNSFAFNSNLSFTGLKVNNNFLGKLITATDYDAVNKKIFLDGYTSLGLPDFNGIVTKNIQFKGNYFLDKKEESIDIDFKATPANLKLLNPFLEGILTINNAMVTGEGKVHGSPDNLKVDGKLKLYQSEIKVDYTNVTYNISGEIEIMPDQIRFSDLLLKEKGLKAAPQGTVNGNVFHNNFSRIQLDYDVTYRNMLVLNTTQKENKTFYGKMYGSGNIGIWGFLNNLHMQVIDTITNKNSKFVLPLDGPAEVSENDFVTFVKKDTVKKQVDEPLTGFDLNMFVSVTPDLQTQIILDSKSGDMLNVSGLGDINMKISTLGKFEMVGDYIITNGDYLFTLENVINKKFDIDAGSTISWSGDPLGAEINITTSYRQRASVAPLLNDTTGRYKGRFPVDCKLKITDKLFSPNIDFAIEFPSVDATARARIENVLSDEVELNRQVFSFLLFRTFVTPQIFNNNSGGVTAGGAAASTGSELLSNRLSSFLDNYVGNLTGINDLQVGLNYRAGSNTGNEVDLALSKQLFNNKVSIDGNFGVNNNQNNRNSSGIIDVNIEYKLTDDGRYRVKGFNRSNDNNQIATSGGPYTQGIGLFYREEFETVNQLFQRYLEKFGKKKSTTTIKKPD